MSENPKHPEPLRTGAGKPGPNGKLYQKLVVDDTVYETTYTNRFTSRKAYAANDPREIKARLPGTILRVYTSEGHAVKRGEPILLLEAMKMENNIVSLVAGKVKKLHVQKGDLVSKDQLLVEIE